ncbi:MAG: hypothetical protein Q4E59_00655 [Bacteroidales bacterium]|nr:hypothetical protein [Bacteroidales bacterium]
MIKEIKYNGYTATPSDYECPDGDLALAYGLVGENGTLKPILPPTPVLTLSDERSLKFVHQTALYKHYIFVEQQTDEAGVIEGLYNILWMDSDDTTTYNSLYSNVLAEINSFDAVGNTLIAFTDSSMLYFLWENGSYRYLGDKLPDVNISFGLVGKPLLYSVDDEDKSTFNITVEGVSSTSAALTSEKKSALTEEMMAKVNKFIAEHSVQEGKFCLPFLVRYALRLYDGTLAGHSAPILMLPSTRHGVIPFSTQEVYSDGNITFTIDMMMMQAQLDYSLCDAANANIDEDWKDIITSVDVFISAPIYTHDQSGTIEEMVASGKTLKSSQFFGKIQKDFYTALFYRRVTQDETYSIYDYHLPWSFFNLYALFFSPDTEPTHCMALPEFENDDLLDTVNSTSNFYLLHTIELKDLVSSYTERKTIEVDDDYLQSLVSREVMTDDYRSHDKLTAEHHYVYNNRLNLSGVTRTLFEGWVPDALVCKCDGSVNIELTTTDSLNYYAVTPVISTSYQKITFVVNENDKEFVVTKESVRPMYAIVNMFPLIDSKYDAGYPLSRGSFLYYPNTNAKTCYTYDGSKPYKIHEMTAHDFLNGAYTNNFIEMTDLIADDFTDLSTTTSTDLTVAEPNKIYTSVVSNPFYFPATGINSVGDGTVLGIASATKALSEGQFGEFPLYAFTSEGVWALAVSSDGTYSSVQPVSRDVCINADSITQIDSAVLFATARGIMLISGSTVTCLSDTLDADDYFSLSALTDADAIISIFNSRAAEAEQITLDDISMLPFTTFLAACRMIYDYKNQRIIVYNPDVRYAYVYSLKSKTWGMMRSDIQDNINSYPDALAIADTLVTTTADDGTASSSWVPALVDIATPSADTSAALLVTRPFKMDAPDIFKTVRALIQRGVVATDHVAQALYGSNDLTNWLPVWSSADKYMRGLRGTPFKYFRLVAFANLDKTESLYGFSVDYERRLANQLR